MALQVSVLLQLLLKIAVLGMEDQDILQLTTIAPACSSEA